MADPDWAPIDGAITALSDAADALDAARIAGGDPVELAAIAADLDAATAALSAASGALSVTAPDLREDRSLPMITGADRVVTMARDPESVFTYWELTAAGVGRAKASLDGPADLTLRVYFVPDQGARTVRDIPVTDWLGRHTIQVDRPGIRVVTAIGFKSGDSFAHVAQAAAVRLPRRRPGSADTILAEAGADQAKTSNRIIRPTIVHLASELNGPKAAPVVDPSVDSAALRGFALGQAVEGGVMSDLQRVVGSNHLIEGGSK